MFVSSLIAWISLAERTDCLIVHRKLELEFRI